MAPAPDSSSRLLRSSAVVAAGTLSSRVTGLIRTIAQAAALGGASKGLADTYGIANTAPNLLFDLLAGGVLAATIVPALADARLRRDRDATSAAVTVLGVAMLGLAALSLLTAPIIAVAFGQSEVERRLTLNLLLCFLPQIFFYGLTALLSGLLNAHRRFAAAAFVPTVNNVVTVAVFLFFLARMGRDATAASVDADTAATLLLGLGTTAGIVLMALLLTPAVARMRLGLQWRFDRHHPIVRSMLALSGWTFGYVATNQVLFWTIFRLAKGHGDGELANYQYAYQFFQLPYGILAASVITAFLPDLAERVRSGDQEGFGLRFLEGCRLTLLLIAPATVALLLVAPATVSVLLERGSFGAADAERTGAILAAFATGLPGFCLYMLAMRGFYAHHNTKVPFLVNLGQSCLFLGLCLLFVGPWGAVGLALAFGLSYAIGAVAALAWLDRYAGPLPWRGSLPMVVKTTVAAMAMAGVVLPIAALVGSDHGGGAWLRVLTAGGAGLAVFAAAAVALRIPEVHRLRRLLPGGAPPA